MGHLFWEYSCMQKKNKPKIKLLEVVKNQHKAGHWNPYIFACAAVNTPKTFIK